MNVQVNHWFSVRTRSGLQRAEEIIEGGFYSWSQPKPQRPLIRACCNEAGMQASDEAALMDEVEESCQQCYASSSRKTGITRHTLKFVLVGFSNGLFYKVEVHNISWIYRGHEKASGESMSSRRAACGQTRAQEWNGDCEPLILDKWKYHNPVKSVWPTVDDGHLEGLWKGLWNHLAQFLNAVVWPRKQLHNQYLRNCAALQGLPNSGCPCCSLSKQVMVEKLPWVMSKH